jgi:uncharacterized delta-60 repeat protein
MLKHRVPMVAVIACLVLVLANVASAAPGDLDPTFGGNGIVETVSGTAVDLSGGRIVAGGSSFSSGQVRLSATRVRPNGLLDSTFGGDGRAQASFNGDAYGRDVVVQADGKVVVAGTKQSFGPYASAVVLARFRADGTLDWAFSADGKVTTNLAGFAQGEAVTLQADGKIVVAGLLETSDTTKVLIMRYMRGGALDRSFGTGGRVTTPVRLSSGQLVRARANELAIAPDGSIVVVGSAGRALLVARYRPNGRPDPTFGGGDGIKLSGGTAKWGGSVALQPDGRIVVAGYEVDWNEELDQLDSFAIVARFRIDGRPDAAFGVVRVAPEGYVGMGSGVTWEPDGKIVTLAGPMIARLRPGGAPDPTFGGGDGIVWTTVAGQDLAIQPDGRLLVVGDDALARFLA